MAQPESRLTIDAYLRHEDGAEVRSEYVEGRLFAMSGASDAHNRLAGNLFALLWSATRGTNGRAYISDMKVRTGDATFYYPDVMVTCEPDAEPYFKVAPCLVVEVLSPSTAAIDHGEKLRNYTRLPSLETYVLVAQDEVRVELYRRAGQTWTYDVLGSADDLILSCPNVTLKVADVYENVRVCLSDEPLQPPRLGS